ncbi:MAG TPA: hypothetical protein ENK56_03720 [Chloroflexi bacterium]|nr:hypothetical protein [Chloroflexota bacterium]
MNELMRVARDWQEVVERLIQALETQGMRVYRSFDLRTALAALPDCGCPHHGTEQCTCQYAVLLVYGDAPSPAQVVTHGRDGQTWLSVLGADDPSPSLKARILELLTATFTPEERGYRHATPTGVAGTIPRTPSP